MIRKREWRSLFIPWRRRRDFESVTKLTRAAVFAMLAISLAGCVDPKRRQEDLNPGFNPYYYGAVVPREDKPPHKWTKFVAVAGQPEPVPAEWVSTPEGQYAHSIVLPDPVPKDSGYRWTMSATDYFLHLCEKEAGEFVYRRVEGVEGILFMRPLFQPTDQDLQDRYRLEAPGLMSGYQMWGRAFDWRAAPFLAGRRAKYAFYEEPIEADDKPEPSRGYLRGSEVGERDLHANRVERVAAPAARYGVIWRGLMRREARPKAIGGEEIIVVELESREVIGLMRRFFLTGRTARTPQGAWWLNAARCPQFAKSDPAAGVEHLERFLASVLVPAKTTGHREVE